MSSPRIGRSFTQSDAQRAAAQRAAADLAKHAEQIEMSEAEREAEERDKAQLLASLLAKAARAAGEAPRVESPLPVAEIEQQAAVTQDVEQAMKDVTIVSEEMARLQTELAELQDRQREETARLEREHAQKLADIQRRQSQAQARVDEARQRQRIVELQDRARRIAEAERKDAEAALASKREKDAALKAKLAPRIAAVAAELAALRGIDIAPLRTIAATNARPGWVQRTRNRWYDTVQRPAMEVVERVTSSRPYFKQLIEDMEAFVVRGHQEVDDFQLQVNTFLRDSGRCIGRAENIKAEMAEISARVATFESKFDVTEAPDVEVDSGREALRQAALRRHGAGLDGGVRLLDGDAPSGFGTSQDRVDSGGLNPLV